MLRIIWNKSATFSRVARLLATSATHKPSFKKHSPHSHPKPKSKLAPNAQQQSPKPDEKKQAKRPMQEEKKAYRDQSALKLVEFASRYSLLRPGMRVLEIGAVPGGWTQVLVRAVNSAEANPTVVAVDLTPMEHMSGVRFIHGDIADEKTYPRIEKAVDYSKVDLVCSDAAPAFTGNLHADHTECMKLNIEIVKVAKKYLNATGDLLMKTVKGLLNDSLAKVLKIYFKEVLLIQATSAFAESEAGSRLEARERENEVYVLARGYMLSGSKELKKMRELKRVSESVSDPRKREIEEKKLLEELKQLRAEEFKDDEIKENDEEFMDKLAQTGPYGRSLRNTTLESIRAELKEKLKNQAGEEAEETEEAAEVHKKFDVKDSMDEFMRQHVDDEELIAERARELEEKYQAQAAAEARVKEGDEREEKMRAKPSNPVLKAKLKDLANSRKEEEEKVITYRKSDQQMTMWDEERLDRQSKRARRVLKSKDRPREENEMEKAVQKKRKSAEFWKDVQYNS